jgi:hypothetical protein
MHFKAPNTWQVCVFITTQASTICSYLIGLLLSVHGYIITALFAYICLSKYKEAILVLYEGLKSVTSYLRQRQNTSRHHRIFTKFCFTLYAKLCHVYWGSRRDFSPRVILTLAPLRRYRAMVFLKVADRGNCLKMLILAKNISNER